MSLRREAPKDAESTAATVSARQYLSGYWGSRWSEIEAEMAAKGVNLDGAFKPVPWEEVASQAEAMFRLDSLRLETETRKILEWPAAEEMEELAKELSIQYETREPVKGHDALALQDIAAPHNRDIAFLAEEYLEGLEQAVQQRFLSGDFVKAPLSTYGVTRPEDLGDFYLIAGALPGWGLVAGFWRKDYPYLMELRDRAHELVHQRDQEVMRYLGQQGYIRFRESTER